jgi:hypothetical protein
VLDPLICHRPSLGRHDAAYDLTVADERHLAVAVAVDEDGRLLVDRATASVLTVEFQDAWPQDALSHLITSRLGVTIPRSRMAATHLDLGNQLFGHFIWLRLHSDEVAASIPEDREGLAWMSEAELEADPYLLAPGPVRSEVLRLAFGWADPAATSTPAIPPKVVPDSVDWADPHVRRAALDAMADRELDMMSGMVGDWEVTVGGGDEDVFMLTADGPVGVLNALGDADDGGEIDIKVGGEVLTLPSAYGLSRDDVDRALADLQAGRIEGPRWELDEG